MSQCSPSTPPALHLVPGEPPRARRKTVAVLLDYMNFFGGGYEADLRRALDERARALDLDMLFVFGRALDEPRQASVAHNVVYDLLDGGAVDGVIVVSTLLSGHAGADGVIAFLETHYRGIPRVSLGMLIPGVPSVVIDNRFGMRALLQHLIEAHDCRRIAFIAGTAKNPEAEERLAVYRETLEEYGLRFDPALVEPGLFAKRSAVGATRTILGRARPDAVVAANDAMALGAIEALRGQGFRVPYDVPVTGFDDLSVARLANPPLTTVAQPFERMAELSLQLLLDQFAGKPAAAVTHLPTVLTLRQSCGCGVRLSQRGAAARAPTRQAALQDLTLRRVELEALLVSCLGHERPASVVSAAELLDALAGELGGELEAFSRVVEAQLVRCGDDNESYRGLQNAIGALRGEFRSNETRELADVWFNALSLVALANTTAQMQHRLAVDETYVRLLNASQAFSVAFDASSLRRMLVKGLPAAGVRTAVVARACDGSLSELEPLVCLHEGLPVQFDSVRYPGHQLFPPGNHWADQRRSFLVFPLAFESQKLGLAIFDMSEGSSGQHVLRDQLSAALKSIELHEAVLLTTTQHERTLQERLAASKRMQSLGVLAGGVAHDLNNALGPLVGLPDIIQRELARSAMSASRDVSADLESIKGAALRASQTIKDLLTLGRQGHIKKEPLSLNQVVSSCVNGELQRKRGADGLRVQVELELCPEKLVVRASETQLARAISNLVHNALEAIQRDGRVRIETSVVRVQYAKPGYEQIEPGEYATVTISDDGSGIAPQEMGRIFEPFFSTKRAGDRSGTGLGLAIVHGVVKEHDGFVDVTSSPGEGTTFTLYFPRTREQPLASERPEPPRPGRARVLIVDDDPVQLRTGKRILTHMGYEVVTQSRGAAAYQLFAEEKARGGSPFDLVILDMSLNEERDGLEVFERIQELYPAQRAIVASGHALNERVERAMSRGLAWLAKPYTADALSRAVQSALAQNAQASGF